MEVAFERGHSAVANRTQTFKLTVLVGGFRLAVVPPVHGPNPVIDLRPRSGLARDAPYLNENDSTQNERSRPCDHEPIFAGFHKNRYRLATGCLPSPGRASQSSNTFRIQWEQSQPAPVRKLAKRKNRDSIVLQYDGSWKSNGETPCAPRRAAAAGLAVRRK